MDELKGIAAYKSKKDLTIEDISLFKSQAEGEIEKVLNELENATGLTVDMIYKSPLRDDLGNIKIEVTLKI